VVDNTIKITIVIAGRSILHIQHLLRLVILKPYSDAIWRPSLITGSINQPLGHIFEQCDSLWAPLRQRYVTWHAGSQHLLLSWIQCRKLPPKPTSRPRVSHETELTVSPPFFLAGKWREKAFKFTAQRLPVLLLHNLTCLFQCI
jgi:hypothetical protein